MPVEEIQRKKKLVAFQEQLRYLLKLCGSVFCLVYLCLSFNLSPCHKVVKKRNTGVLN